MHPPPTLDCAGRLLDLSQPRVMGILNVTPDSFSDGGRYQGLDAALRQAEAMLESGADLIDVGGESTRPGASAVSADEEMDRVLPVLEALNQRFATIVSIDTSKPEVMRAAAGAGAGLINDVRALREPGALQAAAATGLPVCLMHMQGEPRSMQEAPRYDDVVAQVRGFLEDRMQACVAAGIPVERIVLDPGFGFGKTLGHNLELLRGLERLGELARPVLVGVSRKSMIGALLDGRAVDGRVLGSVAAALQAVRRGAAIVRVHDVAETVDALRVWGAIERGTGNADGQAPGR